MTLFVAFLLFCFFGGFLLRDQHVMWRVLVLLIAIAYLAYAYIIGNALLDQDRVWVGA